MYKHAHIILTALVLACASMVVIVIYQLSTIISKKVALNAAEQALISCEAELKEARETLAEVSSSDYHNLYARKKGYGLPDERGYTAR